jgi:hypothetical protein
MATRPAPEKPDWLIPGADVIACVMGSSADRISRHRIAKVSVHSFTLEGSTTRFRVATQDYREPGSWGRRTRIVPVDSEEGRQLLAGAQRSNVRSRAIKACEEWTRHNTGTRELRLAAITALQAVEDDE